MTGYYSITTILAKYNKLINVNKHDVILANTVVIVKISTNKSYTSWLNWVMFAKINTHYFLTTLKMLN